MSAEEPKLDNAAPFERLQKVLAHVGVASRRKCEEYIRQGRVQVNGQIVTELGLKVRPGVDCIAVDGRPLAWQVAQRYYMLYKPVGYLSTVHDPHGRAARELVPTPERLYPVGRLDRESEGLLLFTNDGELAHRLMHPRYEHEKEYLVLVRGDLHETDLERLRQGIHIDAKDRAMRAEDVPLSASWRWRGESTPSGWRWVRIILREGYKRQIRLMLRALEFPVRRLIRVRVATLRLGDLAPAQGRWLTPEEVYALRRFVGLETEEKS